MMLKSDQPLVPRQVLYSNGEEFPCLINTTIKPEALRQIERQPNLEKSRDLDSLVSSPTCEVSVVHFPMYGQRPGGCVSCEKCQEHGLERWLFQILPVPPKRVVAVRSICCR